MSGIKKGEHRSHVLLLQAKVDGAGRGSPGTRIYSGDLSAAGASSRLSRS